MEKHKTKQKVKRNQNLVTTETKGDTKVMHQILIWQNVIAITMKYKRMIHTSFANTRLFSHKVPVIFKALLPTLRRTLYTNVKFPASTSENVTKTLFQFGVHVVQHFQGQKVGSRSVSDLGC
jgi:hypothetical protein